MFALFFVHKSAEADVGLPVAARCIAVCSLAVPSQDTTKRAQDKTQPSPRSEIERILSRVTSKSTRTASSGKLNLLDIRDRQFPELTLDVADSLGRLHPELKEYILQQAIFQGVLQIDLAETKRKKLLDRAFADLRIPGEMESKLRRNQALYGRTDNPMRPPPPPNQVNLFDLIIAISNLLRYLGVK
ncbi:MAG: hypothetical protein Q8P51_12675 [Ignavibacteria bacterium]|nr:hypothetical protein [Ignavibacteria bacterium]